MLLTHPRSLAEPEVADAARQIADAAGTRLFAVSVDSGGEVELTELRRGWPVKLGRSRIDLGTLAEPARHRPAAARPRTAGRLGRKPRHHPLPVPDRDPRSHQQPSWRAVPSHRFRRVRRADPRRGPSRPAVHLGDRRGRSRDPSPADRRWRGDAAGEDRHRGRRRFRPGG